MVLGPLWTVLTTALLAPKVHVTVPGVGRLRGSTLASTERGRPIQTFWGLPYAKEPTGRSRFAPPQTRAPLNDGGSSYDASLLHFLLSPPLCPQMKDSRGFLGLGDRQAPRVPQGNEDCLTLAVHTPSLRPARPLPVVVFIHGGAFIYGSYASIGPQHLLDEDVVLVALSYRLGSLGFLCLDLPSAPGNVGLLDQVLGLKWVQRHISSFGGDPGRVTVMGESAGSASVSLLLMSPLASGLFHRAVMMSGSWPAGWTHNAQPEVSAQRIGRALGCPPGGKEQLLDCLRFYKTAEEISVATEAVAVEDEKLGRLAGLTVPCSQSPGPHQMVPQSLEATDSIAFLNPVPVLLGSTRDEGNLFAGFTWENYYVPTGKLGDSSYFQKQFLVDVLQSVMENGTKELVEDLQRDYFYPRELGKAAAVLPGLAAILGRFIIKQPAYRFGLLLARHQPVYLYSFDHLGENSFIDFLLPAGSSASLPPGVNHSDDLMYLFDVGIIQLQGRDVRARREMVRVMSSFIRGHTPHPGLAALAPGRPDSEQEFLSIGARPALARDYTRTFYRGYGRGSH